jgi:hypothetical protein
MGPQVASPKHRAKPAPAARPAALQNRSPAPKAIAKSAAKAAAAKPVQKLAAPKSKASTAAKPAARGADDDWETF